MNALENREIHELNRKVDNIAKVMESQGKQIGNVLNALMGTELDTDRGMVSVVKELKDKVKTLEDRWNNTKWLMIGIGVASGLTIGKIASLIGASL